MVKILVFSGSTRDGSFNSKLAALAAKTLQTQGAELNQINLKDYELPLYNGDLEKEKGAPDNAEKLARLFESQHGIFITSPEYNASISPLVKNTIDWVSRTKDAKAKVFSRVFALGAASPGGLGGYRGLMQLRASLELGLNTFVIPEMVSVRLANEAFADDGSLKEPGLMKQLEACTAALIKRAALGS
ncbi:MAG: NAD(P)H-dependent oxidoreductase [Pseudomonadota bacterium]